MSITAAVLIALGLLIFRAYSTLSKRLLSLAQQIALLSNEIATLKSTVEEAMMPEVERHERREWKVFDQAEPLTLPYLRRLKPGAVLRLISCSWIYPTDFPSFDRFEYKHGHVDEQSQTKHGYEVHRFWRHSPQDEWQPFNFLAQETEASS
jgi:hypothetical protein